MCVYITGDQMHGLNVNHPSISVPELCHQIIGIFFNYLFILIKSKTENGDGGGEHVYIWKISVSSTLGRIRSSSIMKSLALKKSFKYSLEECTHDYFKLFKS